MPYSRGFYAAQWTEIRNANPDLPTHSGYRRQPEHVDCNYLGHRLPEQPIYVHMCFRGRGLLRTVAVEAYTSNAGHARWNNAVAALNNAVAALNKADNLAQAGLIAEAEDNWARRYCVIAPDLAAEAVTPEVIKAMVTKYRTFLEVLGVPR